MQNWSKNRLLTLSKAVELGVKQKQTREICRHLKKQPFFQLIAFFENLYVIIFLKKFSAKKM